MTSVTTDQPGQTRDPQMTSVTTDQPRSENQRTCEALLKTHLLFVAFLTQAGPVDISWPVQELSR